MYVSGACLHTTAAGAISQRQYIQRFQRLQQSSSGVPKEAAFRQVDAHTEFYFSPVASCSSLSLNLDAGSSLLQQRMSTIQA